MDKGKRIRIGDLLIERKEINQSQLEVALDEQKRSGHRLGKTLIDLKFVTEESLLKLLSEQLNIPFVDLRLYQFEKKLISLLPESQARRFRAVVLAEDLDGLLVGMTDPMDIYAIDEIQNILKRQITTAVVREADLLQTLDTVYRKTDEIASIAGELENELESSNFDLEALLHDGAANDAPVVRLLHTLFDDAIKVNASDIHIEPDESVVRIRLRIDGVLHEQVMNEKRIAAAVVSRLKIMSGLDISEKRLPQDGRFHFRFGGQEVDVRVSTMPVQYGESVVMRLLNQSSDMLSLDNVGMPDRILSKFRQLIAFPHGLILVTGPTGSGKTTSLYGALSELNTPERKIITVEDPVEYRLSRICQVQVNNKIDLSFSRVLRSALRQDPDVVLVGEMRDSETAEIGIRAALTGHLVLSTLHTNDAISSAMRLLDMGVEAFLAASALRGIMAQRLVKKICQYCAHDYELTHKDKIFVERVFAGKQPSEIKMKKGKGCHQCNNTGYSGRIGVFELLEMTDELVDALRSGDPQLFAKVANEQAGFQTLSYNAMEYAFEGKITIEEVYRISEEIFEVTDMGEQNSKEAVSVHSAILAQPKANEQGEGKIN